MSGLNADSSDEESFLVSRGTNLNSQSSDEEENVQRKSLNSQSSDEEVNVQRNNLNSQSSGEEDNIRGNLNSQSSGEEDDVQRGGDEDGKRKSKIASSNDDSDNEEKMKGRSVGKSRRVLDSSDDEENSTNQQSPNKNHGGLFKNKDIFDAESSEDEMIENASPKKKEKKRKSVLAADSSDDEIVNNKSMNAASSDEEGDTNNLSNRISKLGADSSDDSDAPRNKSSDSEGEERLSGDEQIIQEGNRTAEHSKSPKSRKSKSSAIEEIRSETQRLLRESPFQLPYHRPKQRTLEEFLNRKKGTPEIIQNIKEKTFSAADEEKLMARQKQLEEFYKDEEENEADDESENEEKKENTEEKANNTETESDNNVNSDTPLENKENTEPVDNTAVEGESEDVINCDNPVETKNIEPEKEKQSVESLDLQMDETPDMIDTTIVDSSQKNKQQWKLEALRKQFGDKELEKTLNMTPKLGAKDDHFFAPPSFISTGAEKLFKTFMTHVKAPSNAPNKLKNESELNVVVRKKDSSGHDTFQVEKVKIKSSADVEANTSSGKRLTLMEMKKQLKKEVMAKKLQDMKLKEEMSKLNNEEFDELPNDEEIDENEEDDRILDEEEENDVMEDENDVGDDEDENDDEDDVGDEELDDEEENDVLIKERRANRNLFVDDEADVSDNSDNESETESLHLIQEDDEQPKKKSSGYKRLKKPDDLSDDSNPQPSEMETPCNMETASIHSLAGSTVSSSSSIFNTAPRWTPFKDRMPSEPAVQLSMSGQAAQAQSLTASQMTKKRLGFEDLCDDNDPEVDDIGDILGLCSGKFATQKPALPNTDVDNRIPDTQDISDTLTGPTDKQEQIIETQDTLILTGNSRGPTPLPDKLSSINDLLQGNMMHTNTDDHQAYPLFEDFPEEEGRRIIDSDDEDTEKAAKADRKRKRMVISDDEDSDGNKDDIDDSEAGSDQENEDNVNENNDHEFENENEEVEEERVSKARNMFDKKGRLRKDFFEAEAELSGSEEELSDDEDEKDLDRLELEEGDLDDIDETEERDKVGRIYQKNQLDEDQAELKLFQERFLEDGDLHTDNKRQKQFKWKGLDDSLEIDRRVSDGEEEGDEGAEEGELWRIQRLEREKWMKENRENAGGQMETESKFFQIAAKALAKVSSTTSSPSLSTNSSQSSGPLQPLNVTKMDQRSSFLSRGQASLESLSIFSKRVDDRSGTGAKKGRNFVFTALSPEKSGQPADQNLEESASAPITSKTKKPQSNPAKKQKIDRSISSDSRSTIFNFL